MATVSKLKKILEVLEADGKGKEHLAADHDQIFLSPPGDIAEDSEIGKKLEEAGASYNEQDGWYIFT